MEDIARQKKQHRLSASGLKAPSVGKSTENVAAASSATSSPKSKEASPNSVRGTPPPDKSSPAHQIKKSPPEAEQQTPKSFSAPKAIPAPKAVEAKTKTPPVESKSLSKTSAADISAMSASFTGQIASLESQQELDNMRLEVKDLEEKLDTLKVRRSEDKNKMKDFEKVKMQLHQLTEYKLKIQETQSDLQRQLQASKKDAKDIQDAFDRYKDEMSDFAETVEIATLDKEMAEEKCESLQNEVDSMKEKLEEMSLDLQIMKEDMESAGSTGGATNYQVKQLEQQNERLKEALVKVRDLSNHEKQEQQRLQKQVDKLTSEAASFTRDKDKLEREVGQLQEEVLELKEQVDAAQGAEDMVEQLTEKTLVQEEKLQELEDEKTDLEALCEMNDELQENARDGELELREEVDMANARATEAKRKLDAMQESIADYEATVSKFRELVAQLQESNRELRSKQAQGDSIKSQPTPTIEMFDFKAKFAETKATAKAIDIELRKLDVAQGNKHVNYLCSFMPDTFMKRGGDHDAVLVMLLIPRMISKTELLILQTKQKFDVPETLEKEQVIKTHQSDGFSFANKFVHALCILQATLKQYDSALNTCSTELYLKIGTLLPELASHENNMDNFIELLRKDQLDETISLASLQKSVDYFKHLYSVHLAGEKLSCTNYMADHTRIMLAGCDCMHIDVARLKLILQQGQETSDISILLRDLENFNHEIRLNCRKIKRRIPQQQEGVPTPPLSFGKDVQDNLSESVHALTKVVKTLQNLSTTSMQQAALLTGEQSEEDLENQGLQSKKMEELAFQASDAVYGKEDNGPFDCLRQACSEVGVTVKKLATAMENGEYDFDGTKEQQPVAPVLARITAVKVEFADVENVKIRLESKDEDIKDLKRQIRLKQEELSEQQIRVGLIERKLENSNKDSDDRVEKVQQKLDEATVNLRKKEKEFEETLDALQADIDTLEAEKAELKERLKAISKKSLLEGLSRQSGQSVGSPPAGAGVVMKDSPTLLQQIDSLKEALQHVKIENTRLSSLSMKEKLDRLPPIHVPKKPIGMSSPTGSVKLGDVEGDGAHNEDLRKLSKDTGSLLNDLYKLSACPKVVDISKRKSGTEPVTDNSSPMSQLVNTTAELARLNQMSTELQVQVTMLLAANRTGGQIRTDFSAFPTPALAKVLHERSADSKCIGVIRIPTKRGEGNTIPVHVGPQQLKNIHTRFVS